VVGAGSRWSIDGEDAPSSRAAEAPKPQPTVPVEPPKTITSTFGMKQMPTRKNQGWRRPADRLNRYCSHESWIQYTTILSIISDYRCVFLKSS
jgi:hypothetical protein